MLENILKLNGIEVLSKSEQKQLIGGIDTNPEIPCGGPNPPCPPGYCCGRGQNIQYACVIAEPGFINCL